MGLSNAMEVEFIEGERGIKEQHEKMKSFGGEFFLFLPSKRKNKGDED